MVNINRNNYNKLTSPKNSIDVFLKRSIPHKTESKSQWCVPVWYAWIFGGTYDSGNGYGWRPTMYQLAVRYYNEEWYKAGYTLWAWLHYPKYNNIGGDNIKRYCQRHGLW